MPSLLHRLNVRALLLAALGIDGLKVESREVGQVDVTIPAGSGVGYARAKQRIHRLLADNGIECNWIATERPEDADAGFTVSFTNDLMQRQHLWGARGNNKRWRAAMGITVDEPQPTAQPVEASAVEAGEIPADSQPVEA